MIKAIHPFGMPAPNVHLLPAIVHNGIVYVSGQLPARNGAIFTGPVEEQAEYCLYNIKTILIAAASDLDKVLKASIFIADINGLGGRRCCIRPYHRQPPTCPYNRDD